MSQDLNPGDNPHTTPDNNPGPMIPQRVRQGAAGDRLGTPFQQLLRNQEAAAGAEQRTPGRNRRPNLTHGVTLVVNEEALCGSARAILVLIVAWDHPFDWVPGADFYLRHWWQSETDGIFQIPAEMRGANYLPLPEESGAVRH